MYVETLLATLDKSQLEANAIGRLNRMSAYRAGDGTYLGDGFHDPTRSPRSRRTLRRPK
jgi:hypothetical protein